MEPSLHELPPHARTLLEVLSEPSRVAVLCNREWDILLRSARSARLLGVLQARLDAVAGLIDILAPPIQRQLTAGWLEARYRRHKARFLYEAVSDVLAPVGAPLVLLKGAGYIEQGLRAAEGRMPADVDLMLPKVALAHAEQLLTDAGWQFEKTDPYDQHYYRAWSHELPPMQCAGQALELDVHHTILPPVGRLKPDTELLFRSAIAAGKGTFKVLCPEDQLLHAAAHLFQDSDCVGRIRDLVDIDGLAREFARGSPAFWESLHERARLHQLGRPLWYALTLCRRWLNTPVPENMEARLLSDFRPPMLARSLFIGLASHTLPPVDPESSPTVRHRLFATVLEVRALWLRMPPWTLAYHSFRKGQRTIVAWWRSRRAAST